MSYIYPSSESEHGNTHGQLWVPATPLLVPASTVVSCHHWNLRQRLNKEKKYMHKNIFILHIIYNFFLNVLHIFLK